MKSTSSIMNENEVRNAFLDICPIKSEKGYHKEPHVQNEFEIIWIQTGTGFHEVNACRHRLANDKVYCAMPGQLHHLQINSGSEGVIIRFSQSFLYQDENFFEVHNTGLFPLLSQSPGMALTKEIADDMLDITVKMMKESTNYFLLGTEMLKRYLKIFLIYLIRQVNAMEPGTLKLKNVYLFNKFTALLEKDFRKKKMVSDYAKDLFLTANYLNELIKKTSGYPASYHISQRIVQEAKRKAVYSGYTLKEIAYDLGFGDVSHFSKYFKNASGNNFSDFKKKYVNASN